MTARAMFYEKGDKIDYTAIAAVAYHEPVVVGTVVGVATKALAIGETGNLDVSGVFEMDKKAADVITQGAKVYLLSDKTIASVTAEGAVAAGTAWRASAAEDTKVMVKING